ncbi:ABC-type sugar transport system, permease component [Lactobacillus selangorensis]|uniref:ABC-type sugar transport system, permease component n=1 Tax=Lactobacillus selangorensis TaxID=81857 RepID=A0A0R2FN67_9LACO|nr:carbohydrate ABC transporter permease [Lactobacillus selangorensis]KRN27281.1 ABC-type sugar transport system, permease component [Lactobacillus selangorensis]KRN29936.1 ABC-type sugar transport system, permease component [Lactobacillus selangorensis]
MNRLKNGLQYLLLTGVAVLLLFPLLLGFWASLLPTKEIAAGRFLATNLSWHNYEQALLTTPLIRYLANSLVTAGLITFGQLLLCTLAADAFVFSDLHYKKQLFAVFLVTMMLPFEAQIIPNFQTIKAFGWLDHYAGLTVPFFTSAFGVFMLRQAFLQLPADLVRFGQYLGLSQLQFLWKIVVPYSRSMLVTFGLYTFLTQWNQYLWPLITTFSDDYRPVQVGLKQLQSEDTFANWGMLMATAMIVLVPTLVLLICGQKFFKHNLNAGGTKG